MCPTRLFRMEEGLSEVSKGPWFPTYESEAEPCGADPAAVRGYFAHSSTIGDYNNDRKL